jgi:DNA-binding NarL/FixJ family response regulator
LFKDFGSPDDLALCMCSDVITSPGASVSALHAPGQRAERALDVLRVLLLEDDAHSRALLRDSVAALGREALITEADTVAQARQLLAQTRFDLFLADLRLPDGDSLELVRRARSQPDPPAVLVVSSLADEATVVRAILAGAGGYVCKHDAFVEITRALAVALDGGASISPTIAHRLLDLVRSQCADSDALGRVDLTARESEVLRLSAQGHTYRQIAALAGISPSTVYTHVRHIYEKLHVSSLQEALFQARRRRLV